MSHYGFGFGIGQVKKAGVVSYDADAQAFFTATGITDTTQKSAVNQLVLDLKSYNIWSKMKALYPIVGGSASSHAVNLKTPGTYNLTFSTGWTHSTTGMLPNGTSAYANTFLIPTTHLIINNTHLSYYSRTNISSNGWDIGMIKPTNQSLMIACKIGTTNLQSHHYNNGTERILAANANTLGLHISTRTANNILKINKNGSQLGTTLTTITGISFNLCDIDLYVGASNNNGTAAYFGQRQCAFASIGDGLDDTEAANFYTAVQAYQTTLSRNV